MNQEKPGVPKECSRAIELVAKYGLTNEMALNAFTSFWDHEVVVQLLCDEIDRDETLEDFEEFLECNSAVQHGRIVCDSSCPVTNHSESANGTSDLMDDEAFLKMLETIHGESADVSKPSENLVAPSGPVGVDTDAEGSTFSDYLPDEWDMKMLAWAYLDEFIKLEMHQFTTGWSDKAHLRLEKFELIAGGLGKEQRSRIIEAMDFHQERQRGDDWHVYKRACVPGFWPRPVDDAAVLRVANSILCVPEDRLEGYGLSFLVILKEAKFYSKQESEPASSNN